MVICTKIILVSFHFCICLYFFYLKAFALGTAPRWSSLVALKRQSGSRNQSEIRAVFSPCTDEATIWARLSTNMPGVETQNVVPTISTCNNTQYVYEFYLQYNATNAGSCELIFELSTSHPSLFFFSSFFFSLDPTATQNAYSILNGRQANITGLVSLTLLPPGTSPPSTTKAPSQSKPWIPIIIVLVIILIIVIIIAVIVVYCTEKRKKEADEVTSHNFH